MKFNKLILISILVLAIPLVNAETCPYTDSTITCGQTLERPATPIGTLGYFRYTLSSTQRVTVTMRPKPATTSGPDYDMYTSWTSNTCPYNATYKSTDCGYTFPGAGIPEICSRISNPLPAGTYWIAVHNVGPNYGTYNLTVQCQAATTSTSTSTSTTTKTTIPPCIDSDNGKNYFVKGTCSAIGNVTSYTDYCNVGSGPDANYVLEYFCSGLVCLSERHTCTPYACFDGKCVSTSTSPTTIPPTSISTSTSTTTSTTTRKTTTTYKPQPRGGGGGGRPLRMGTTEGLNNPIVILVALIAIVVIIYGAFKFFAMPKKHR